MTSPTNRKKMRTMRPALAVLVSLALAGCGETTIQQQPDQPDTAEAKPDKSPAHVGDPITIAGPTDERLQITLLKVIDPLTDVGVTDVPAGSGRYVGIRVQLRNVGDVPYRDSPSNGAVLLLGGGEQASSTIVVDGQCGTGFAEQANVSPRARRRGCIAFEVPGKRKIKGFQFTLASGFGDETAEWKIP